MVLLFMAGGVGGVGCDGVGERPATGRPVGDGAGVRPLVDVRVDVRRWQPGRLVPWGPGGKLG